METVQVSGCCRASVRDGWRSVRGEDPVEVVNCAACGRECEVEEVCADCLGEGELAVDEDDGEGHTMRGVGTEKCHCQQGSSGSQGRY